MRSIYSLIIIVASIVLASSPLLSQEKTPVFVFTDININSGDPDDRQSLVHLLWYTDELEVKGIVPERWDARSVEACELALDAYQQDYETYDFDNKGFPNPTDITRIIAHNPDEAEHLLLTAASQVSDFLYVLIWGNMDLFQDIITKYPDLSDKIRLITIGTGLMMEQDIPYMPDNWPKSPPCKQLNWNGKGRNKIYTDHRFDKLWWIEMNWTYAGMFTGDQPKLMLDTLSTFGDMGHHMKYIVKNDDWAQYFRVGDTPSVLYLLDRYHNPDNPSTASWAGRFHKPFPLTRPSYYTDISETIDWDYSSPCSTWGNHEKIQQLAKSTLEKERPEMYQALINKLNQLYR